jgi:copper chaperone
MENVILALKGMSCGHCINSIVFDSKVVSLKEITDVIEEQGYDVGTE